MGLLDGGITGLADELGKSGEAAKRDSFNQNFNVADFDTFGGDTLPDQYSEVARYTVPAGTEVSWGFGAARNEANQGYIYALFKDEGDVQITNAKVRLLQENPTGRREIPVTEFTTDDVDNDRYDRSQQPPLPEQQDKPIVTQDSAIVVQVKDPEGRTVSAANSDVRLPVTEYEV